MVNLKVLASSVDLDEDLLDIEVACNREYNTITLQQGYLRWNSCVTNTISSVDRLRETGLQEIVTYPSRSVSKDVLDLS